MPARYDTIIVVRKRNARGEVVEYHTVGRRGPSIWRTGEPNPPGTPGYQAAFDAAIGVRAVIEPPATGHGWCTVSDLLDAYERSREFCRLAPRTRTDYLKGLADVRAQVRQRAARHHQQRRAQGQRARLDRGALEPARPPTSASTRSSSRSAGRPDATPSGCRSTTCTASRASTRAPTAPRSSGRTPRSTCSAAGPPSCTRTRCGWRGRPGCASATSSSSSAARSRRRRMAAARSSCARTSGGGAS